MLTAEQLAAAKLDPASAFDESNELATSCTWKSSDGTDALRISINVSSWFELMYASVGRIPDVVAFALAGYPAVREGNNESSTCAVYAAVAEDQVFSVDLTSRSGTGLCTRAEDAGEAIIAAIGARSR